MKYIKYILNDVCGNVKVSVLFHSVDSEIEKKKVTGIANAKINSIANNIVIQFVNSKVNSIVNSKY